MQQCFWDGFEKNKSIFCEEQLCSFVTEPANTWTNLAYLLVAILILRDKEVTSLRVKRFFSVASLCLFIGSTLFHMTSTYWGKFLDVSTMFIISMTVLALSMQRYANLTNKKTNIFFGMGMILSITFLYFMRFGNVLFVSQILAATLLEFKLSRGDRSLDMKAVKNAILILVVAFTFWLLDVFKILCQPGNHFLTGHGVWHILAGVSFFVFFRSYKGKKL